MMVLNEGDKSWRCSSVGLYLVRFIRQFEVAIDLSSKIVGDTSVDQMIASCIRKRVN